jgi:glycosyltransferase involved in cell wall biosynthesis
MNILQVTASSQLIGGADRYVFDVSPALQQQGDRVAVAYVGGRPEPRLAPLGLRELWLGRGDADATTLTDAFIAAVDTVCPDVIVFHTSQHPELMGASATLAPTVEFVHNHNSYCASGEKVHWGSRRVCERRSAILPCLFFHAAERCGSRRPGKAFAGARRASATLAAERRLAGLVTASGYVREQLVRHGVSPDRVTVVPYPVPVLPPAPDTTPDLPGPRLLFVGRLVRTKGVELLLDALHLVPSAVFLDVAGEGWRKPALVRRAAELGLAERVRFHGWTDGAALSRLYQRCVAVVVPSAWPEPFGLVALEAMAHGKPVIATAVGGLPEVVLDGLTGFLVPPFDEVRLAERLSQLAADERLACRMGETGRARVVEEHRIDLHLQRLTGALQRAIGSADLVAR